MAYTNSHMYKPDAELTSVVSGSVEAGVINQGVSITKTHASIQTYSPI